MSSSTAAPQYHNPHWKQQRNVLFIAFLALLGIVQLSIVIYNGHDSMTKLLLQRHFYETVTEERRITTATTAEEALPEPQLSSSLQQPKEQQQRREDDDEYMSACLYLDLHDTKNKNDDRHSSLPFALQEWLAYHYHVLPLRYLIVTTSPPLPPLTTTTTTTKKPINNNHNDHWRHVLDTYRNHHKLNLTILEWTDADFMPRPIVHTHVKPYSITPQERKQLFYDQCLKSLQDYHRQKKSKSAWTWFVHHVNQYLLVWNPPLSSPSSMSLPTIQEPGSVLHTLQWLEQEEARKINPASSQEQNATTMSHRSSFSALPSCLESSTLDAVAAVRITTNPNNNEEENLNHIYQQQLPTLRALTNMTLGLQTWQFQQAQRRRRRGGGKVPDDHHQLARLLDLTRIRPGDLLLVPPDDRLAFHNPKTTMVCQTNHTSLLAVVHIDQPSSQPTKKPASTTKTTDQDKSSPQQQDVKVDLRPWTVGFVQSVGQDVAIDLLSSNHNNARMSTLSSPSSQRPFLEERCAMLFFGLPRAYDTMVLPSITQNVLIPNARHNCDVFVHYYYMTAEPAGRKNKGGVMDPTSIFKLADAVRLIARNYPSSRRQPKRVPHVAFTHDTDDSFWHVRNRTVHKYRTAKDANGNYLYFPYKAVSYVYPSSLDNIAKQWHSIESVWNLMERFMRQGMANYTRVALLRNDVMFVTPIDIYRTSLDDPEDDVQGRYAIIPPFGLYPVNDRLVYGPYRAVKIWATKRFEYIEDHVRKMPWGPGYGMHSELFLQKSILAAMERDAGVNVTMNPDICFFRTRADNTAMISDCDAKGKTRGIDNMNKEGVVKEISGFSNCTRYKMGFPFEAVTCIK